MNECVENNKYISSVILLLLIFSVCLDDFSLDIELVKHGLSYV